MNTRIFIRSEFDVSDRVYELLVKLSDYPDHLDISGMLDLIDSQYEVDVLNAHWSSTGSNLEPITQHELNAVLVCLLKEAIDDYVYDVAHCR